MTEKKEVKKAVQAEASIYIGPSKMGELHIANGTIYKDGKLPAHLVQLQKKDKDFAALVVPVSKLGATKNELLDMNSSLNLNYDAFALKEV